jgi:hypothetical protein
LLLKQFAVGGSPRLYQYDKNAKTTIETSVGDAGVEKHFNRIETDGLPETNPKNGKSVQPDSVEDAYSEAENVIAPAVDRINSSFALPSDDDLGYILTLLALLDTRTPFRRDQLNNFVDEIIEKVHWMQAQQMGLTPEERDRTIPKVDRKHRNHAIGQELELWSAVTEMMAERPNWSIWVAQEGAGDFILSDRPVAIVRKKFASGWAPLGHAEMNTTLFTPLGGRVLLTGEYEGSPAVRVADKTIIGYFNSMAYAHADRFLWFGKPRFPIMRIPKWISLSEALSQGCRVDVIGENATLQ